MLLYYQSDDTKYEYDRIKRMYEKEVAEAKRRGLTVQEDGLPDASRVDCDLNYHLELVDLLGMCAKGRNEFTEKYVRAVFSEEDVMRVLGDTERVPTLIKSPFVRVLHGVYFSAVTDDADEKMTPCINRTKGERMSVLIFSLLRMVITSSSSKSAAAYFSVNSLRPLAHMPSRSTSSRW